MNLPGLTRMPIMKKLTVRIRYAFFPVLLVIGAFSMAEAAPAVNITAPVSSATVSGSVNVTAFASDAGGIARVVFYVDGVSRSTDSVSPYSWNWDTTRETDSVAHAVQAEAFSNAGQATRKFIGVTVNNATPKGSDEHVWLHVEGKYIRTSPYAYPPNQIWTGGGCNFSFEGNMDDRDDATAGRRRSAELSERDKETLQGSCREMPAMKVDLKNHPLVLFSDFRRLFAGRVPSERTMGRRSARASSSRVPSAAKWNSGAAGDTRKVLVRT